MARSLSFSLNGRSASLEVEQDALLLNVLRGPLKKNGPKYGCGKAQCGACTVLVDDVPARACVLRAKHVEGREVTTLEGLADEITGKLSAVQQGFLEKEGAQCGYCLNGMVMTATAFLKKNPEPTEAQIRDALRHNLCRCGAHKEIIESVLRSASIAASNNSSA